MVACSSAVTALSAPTENAPTRPVSFAAPMMVAAAGAAEYSSSVELRRALRRAADAARVEQPGAGAVVAVDRKLEGARSLDEERPPLLEERLEGVEVDDRRIGFDLTEIGIGRRGHGETRAAARTSDRARPSPAGSVRSVSGLSLDGSRYTLPSVYGRSSSFFGVPAMRRPRTSANCET